MSAAERPQEIERRVREMIANGWVSDERQAVNENSVDTPDNALEIAIGAGTWIRRRLNLTLTEVSQLTGLSGAMLSKIENGQTSASLSTLKTLARAFDAHQRVVQDI